MSKHNRRRSRGARKRQDFFHSTQSSHESSDVDVEMMGMMPRFADFLVDRRAPTAPVLRRNNVSSRQRNDVSARHWYNRYLAWQTRERRQREERDRLKQEQRRIFGGDSQDGEEEDALCAQMMEYFGGLDYLD